MAIAGTNPTDATPARHGSGERTREEAEMIVGPLLARANLLRMRGQWDEAVAVCTEALRQAPESPTAHSLLGDIYEAQGKLDDALQWYGMAVDLAPDRQANREKLERVTQTQRTRLREQEEKRSADLAAHRQRMTGKLDPPTGAPAGSSGGRVAAEKTIEWFDRLFPPGRSESIARLIFAACGILAALIVAAAVFVYTGSMGEHNPSMVTQNVPSSGIVPAISAPDPPVVVAVAVPSPQASPLVTAPAAPGVLVGSAAGAVSPAVSQSAADGLAAARARTTRTLAASGITVTAIRADEQRSPGAVQMDVAVLLQPTETAPATQERVARSAALAARTLTQSDTAAQRITIRVSLRQGASATAAEGVPSSASSTANAALSSAPLSAFVDTPVFTGDISSAALRTLDPSLSPTETLLGQFSNISWEPLPITAPRASTGASSPAAASATASTSVP